MFLDHVPIDTEFLVKGDVRFEVPRGLFDLGQLLVIPYSRSDTPYVAADDSSYVAPFFPDCTAPVTSLTL